ncbi:MAG: DUF3365 domain-containing protein [Oscillibacter sp.]|jgi:uroporphyrin-3 C-methyltransferase|nr:DUF3365 domain-containing protein [Oscillibacter sp.]MCI9375227.1 DUF3365 domain-containing protein [Oscillibacter sp.]
MKFEKRSGGGELPQEPEVKDRKPVVVYIMILFIAAFLLMALSFFMHQRSNTEALGQLQSSVSAMQEAQETQEHVMQLQKELAKANETIEHLSELKGALALAENQIAANQEYQAWFQTALDVFWQMNEAYLSNDLEQCREILDEYYAAHGDRPLGGFTGGIAYRYEEICTALESLPSEDTPETENKP